MISCLGVNKQVAYADYLYSIDVFIIDEGSMISILFVAAINALI